MSRLRVEYVDTLSPKERAEEEDAAWLADFAQQETQRYVVECPPPGTIPPPHHEGCSWLCQLFEECSTPRG